MTRKLHIHSEHTNCLKVSQSKCHSKFY